jgi:hypothetical protein
MPGYRKSEIRAKTTCPVSRLHRHWNVRFAEKNLSQRNEVQESTKHDPGYQNSAQDKQFSISHTRGGYI